MCDKQRCRSSWEHSQTLAVALEAGPPTSLITPHPVALTPQQPLRQSRLSSCLPSSRELWGSERVRHLPKATQLVPWQSLDSGLGIILKLGQTFIRTNMANMGLV